MVPANTNCRSSYCFGGGTDRKSGSRGRLRCGPTSAASTDLFASNRSRKGSLGGKAVRYRSSCRRTDYRGDISCQTIRAVQLRIPVHARGTESDPVHKGKSIRETIRNSSRSPYQQRFVSKETDHL